MTMNQIGPDRPDPLPDGFEFIRLKRGKKHVVSVVGQALHVLAHPGLPGELFRKLAGEMQFGPQRTSTYLGSRISGHSGRPVGTILVIEDKRRRSGRAAGFGNMLAVGCMVVTQHPVALGANDLLGKEGNIIQELGVALQAVRIEPGSRKKVTVIWYLSTSPPNNFDCCRPR